MHIASCGYECFFRGITITAGCMKPAVVDQLLDPFQISRIAPTQEDVISSDAMTIGHCCNKNCFPKNICLYSSRLKGG